jgi:hypothetical protein
VGTAGAYHAGVLKALHEAGVKLDVVAGCGVGAIGALFAAADGGARLWGDNGLWRDASVTSFYEWRPALRITVRALALSLALVALPILAVAAGLVVFPIDFLLKMIGLGSSGLVTRYLTFAQAAFASGALPTWLPRLVVIVMGATAAILFILGWLNAGTRRRRGPLWWRTVSAPLSSDRIVARCWSATWDLVRGAASTRQPDRADIGRRYTDLLNENLGQPGFRELLIAVHDVDAHRDLVFALVDGSRRNDLLRRATTEDAEGRRADVQDLSGVAGAHLTDAVAGALAIPLATDFHAVQFAPESYWRGESHRLSDRPAALSRLVEELAGIGVVQVLLVSAAPEAPGPHSLTPPRLDARGRLGEYLQSAESAVVRDVVRGHHDVLRVFVIQPAHNAVGPFDFSGGFDDRSDRPQPLGELIDRGYEDAYLQFIEPVLGASGERVGQRRARG